jgi:phosphoenolpyruvate synthase/pyruvate phosphate dikinase
MYESYLNVGLDDLIDAVQRCFDSAEADRVRIYQSSVRTDGGDAVPGAAMAVLVQQMVDQASAGVAFTANPLTGARDETVISAVPGLAESVVAGVGDG